MRKVRHSNYFLLLVLYWHLTQWQCNMTIVTLLVSHSLQTNFSPRLRKKLWTFPQIITLWLTRCSINHDWALDTALLCYLSLVAVAMGVYMSPVWILVLFCLYIVVLCHNVMFFLTSKVYLDELIPTVYFMTQLFAWFKAVCTQLPIAVLSILNKQLDIKLSHVKSKIRIKQLH